MKKILLTAFVFFFLLTSSALAKTVWIIRTYVPIDGNNTKREEVFVTHKCPQGLQFPIWAIILDDGKKIYLPVMWTWIVEQEEGE